MLLLKLVVYQLLLEFSVIVDKNRETAPVVIYLISDARSIMNSRTILIIERPVPIDLTDLSSQDERCICEHNFIRLGSVRQFLKRLCFYKLGYAYYARIDLGLTKAYRSLIL